ncbi:hypothetical protein [Pseudomonas syringae]|uniref:hypothetical protein n=2 Tax=Pseudomonas syringae group TaxID=136849 RepID=UPI00245AD6F7|nr:hypothetical protein [Pseudomonas syringae]MDH4602367.1 hypothetical protein [Pseudomonas syringae pv. papulans]
MKLVIAQLMTLIAAVGLLDMGRTNADLALSTAGLITLALSVALMVAGAALEVFEWLREGSLS